MAVALNLVIPDDKKEVLEAIAVKKGLSLSGLVRMALYEYIEAQQVKAPTTEE